MKSIRPTFFLQINPEESRKSDYESLKVAGV